MAAAAEKFVVSVDVGTTNIKACVYDKVGTIRGEAREEVGSGGPFAYSTKTLHSTKGFDRMPAAPMGGNGRRTPLGSIPIGDQESSSK